jgi:hypothetical protein
MGIILKWIFKVYDVGGGYGLDYSGSEKGQKEGGFECGNEHSGSIKCDDFLTV